MIKKATLWDSLKITEMWSKMRLEVDPNDTAKAEIFFVELVTKLTQPNWIILIAKEDNETVGFIMGEIMLPKYRTEFIGHCEAIYVEPEYRSRGIMDSLIAGLREEAGKHGVIEEQFNSVYRPTLIDAWKRMGYEPYLITYRRIGNDSGTDTD